ncbi:hypothetical protein IEO21_01547 [Rhodonia placenta]|uniref:C4-dicarboxylate transporter/malic acid transport protein n=1 Tax=Rhodonia placenta TaxID=104341 RepID=A0A8H7P9L8_9APHY|nr:hypothetical protein IEO21_01547 [Postia placenta]
MASKNPPRTVDDIARHFSPAWFTVIMGTGAVSMVFNNFPYATHSATLKIFSAILFFLNLSLFIIFNILSLYRYLRYPQVWSDMLCHPVQSLYLGTYAMGFSTIINVGVQLIYEEYKFGGPAFLYFLWACWWYDVVLSFLCGFVLVHIMMTRQPHRIETLTTVWILPPAALVVASSTGGIIAEALQSIHPSRALLTLTVSAFMVTTGLLIDFMLYTLYFLRLLVHGLPERTNVLSSFIALGPTGQGGFSIMQIGKGFAAALPLQYGTSSFLRDNSTGSTINVICMVSAFIMWAITTMWFFYAVLAVQHGVRKTRFPFSLPFWGLIFPNGVYADLTISLYSALDSKFFRVWGAIYGAATIALWLVVFMQTLPLVWSGVIFNSPDLEKIDGARDFLKREQSGLEDARIHREDTAHSESTRDG